MEKRYVKLSLTALLMLIGTVFAFAQQGSVRGKVVDETSQPLRNATVRIVELNRSAGTDEDGQFSFSDVPVGTYTVTASYLSYNMFETKIKVTGQLQDLNITLTPDQETLEEVVVIGYGTQRRDELTGSISSISEDDFQTGVITSPEQLIQGKTAGVQITSSGGRPGAGSTIRIRSGASLNASNDPLIVIDGVPISNFKNPDGSTSLGGSANPLALINPNDIETFTVMKDANATAIYGSRASNGVILITTKKGASGKPRLNYSAQHSLATVDEYYPVMTADQLREYVTANGNAEQIARLGNADTDWQKAIYRPAYTTDQNLSLSGAVKNMPYRFAAGYISQQGVLKEDVMDRATAAISLTPKFFNNTLKIDFNVKGSYQKSFFANDGAIGAATMFDPTQPIYDPNSKFDGFFEFTQGGNPHPLAARNPVALIRHRSDKGRVARSFGNIQLDYNMPFIRGLRANLNLGYDVSRGQGKVYVPAFAAQSYNTRGFQSRFMNDHTNLVSEFFLNYTNDFTAINSHLDLTAGYGYYDYKTHNTNYPTWRADGSVITEPVFPFDTPQNRLISYYGRAIYTANNKYIFSGTIRTDGSSRFGPDNRWGIFPSAGFTWRVGNEPFLENAQNLSKLNLRLSYGVTGQQDGIANYSYMANYYLSVNESQYQFGDSFYNTYTPIAYDADIRWESTATFNAGVDFGLWNNRIDGSVDFYRKDTKDLLSVIPIPMGTNFSNFLLTNVGNMENTGVELNLNAFPIRRDNFAWNVNFNFTYQHNKVTNLTAVDDPSYFVPTGGISGGTGQQVQSHTVGYSPFTYRLYKQVYDETGRPLEGVYADLNGDGQITPADRRLFGSPLPRYLMGFSTGFEFANWSFNTVLRSNLGHYVYDNISSDRAIRNNVINPAGYINNAPPTIVGSNFMSNQAISDYYLHDGSFLRMDNISLGYNFRNALGNGSNLRLTANVQNVFVVSKYHGLDPELQTGIDNNLYPRPRTFVLGLNLDL